jgi:hypothetical protein
MLQNNFFKILFVLLLLFKIQTGSAQNFETVMRKAYALLTIAQERDRLSSEKLDDIKSRRIRAEEDYVDAQDGKKMSKKDKADAEKLIKLLRKEETEIQSVRRDANMFLSEVSDIIKAPEKKRSKYITDYEKRAGKLEADEQPPLATTLSEVSTPANSDPVSIADNTKQSEKPAENPVESSINNETSVTDDNEPVKETKKGKKDKKGSKKEPKKEVKKEPKKEKKNSKDAPILTKTTVKYNPQTDVALNPPTPDCVLAFDGIDNFTQRKRRETSPQILFRHTEDFMRATLAKDKEYINCEVTASRVQGGFYYINLGFTILTKEAQKSFGFLDKGTSFVFKLTNGRIITLTSSKTDIGVVDIGTNTTVYKAQLQLSSSDVKAMMESELDIFRVAWSAGYEDYEIYNMDVMQNVMRCLEKEAK